MFSIKGIMFLMRSGALCLLGNTTYTLVISVYSVQGRANGMASVSDTPHAWMSTKHPSKWEAQECTLRSSAVLPRQASHSQVSYLVAIGSEQSRR